MIRLLGKIHMQQKDLILYRVIDVDGRGIDDTTKNQTKEQKAIFEESPFLGIELQGRDLLRLAQVFLTWRGRVNEISYRGNFQGKAIVIFSRLNPEQYFRSQDIISPLLWPENELIRLEKIRQDDQSEEVTVELNKIAVSSENTEVSVLDFLRQLYAMNPKKKSVFLKGNISPYLFLSVIDWFALESQHISYENTSLL